jgi:hypothetical protein
MGFVERTLAWGLSWLAACALVGCNSDHPSSAPLAPEGFSQGVHTSTPTDTGTVLDAGTPVLDASGVVCTPGQQSVPFSAMDPCDQVTGTCALTGTPAISTCLSDGTWDMACACATTATTGTAGTGFAGSGTGVAGGF